MIKIGCSSFAIAQKAYYSRLPIVEINKFRDRAPRTTTVERWKEEAPKEFEFIINAKVFDRRSFDRAFNAASSLRAKVIFFELPANSAPNPDIIGKLQNFFKSLPRNGLTHVWDAPRHWPASVVENMSKSLNISPSSNPLLHEWPFKTNLNYFRLGRTRRLAPQRPFIDEEFTKIKKLCAAKMSYVIFNNGPYAFKDATYFQTLVKGHSF